MAIDTIHGNCEMLGVKTGVLPGTTTEQFVRETYPQAEVILVFYGDR